MKINLSKFQIECKRCEYRWIPRKEEIRICPKCVLPGAMILGDNLPIEALFAGSTVLAETGLSIVKATTSHHYSGESVEVRAVGTVPIIVTPDHPFLVIHIKRKWDEGHRRKLNRGRGWKYEIRNTEWVPASQLALGPTANIRSTEGCGDYLVMPRLRGAFAMKRIKLSNFTTHRGAAISGGKGAKNIFPLNSDTAWLIGLYVADGCSSGKEICFSLGTSKRGVPERVVEIARSLGYTARIKKCRGNLLNVWLPSRILARALPLWCGRDSYTKHFPDWILLHNDLRLVRAALEGYAIGDGSTSKKRPADSYTYTSLRTTSHCLALQSQLALARLGVPATITYLKLGGKQSKIEGRIVTLHDAWMVRYSNRGQHKVHSAIMQIVQADRILLPIRSIRRVPYSGQVCDITTQTGTFILGNVVTHNCKSPYWDKERK